MAKTMTHTAIMRGCDNRTREGYHYTVKLRETAGFWVSEHGTKHRKLTGSVPGEKWPLVRLDMESIKAISNDAT